MNEILRTHLIRLAAWSVFCIIASVIPLVLRKKEKGVLTSFLYMSATWCLINLIIVAATWNSETPTVPAIREFMKLMEGMNLGYIAVGLALAIPKQSSAKLCGAGWAVALQGCALYALDKYLFAQIAGINL